MKARPLNRSSYRCYDDDDGDDDDDDGDDIDGDDDDGQDGEDDDYFPLSAGWKQYEQVRALVADPYSLDKMHWLIQPVRLLLALGETRSASPSLMGLLFIL